MKTLLWASLILGLALLILAAVRHNPWVCLAGIVVVTAGVLGIAPGPSSDADHN